jgi:DNA-binding beta-propeller fold protein YncE
VLTGFTIDSYQPTGNATSQLQYVASYPLGDQVQRGFGVAPGRNYPAAQYDNQSQVTVFDTGSMAIGSPSASIGGQVGGIAIAPDGSRVYVGMFGSVNNGIIRARSCPAGSAAELRCRRPMQRSAPPASLRDAKLGRPRISKKVRN